MAIESLWHGNLRLTSDPVLGTVRLRFAYGPAQEMHYYEDGPGRPSAVTSGIFGTRWDFDERGSPIRKTYLDRQGNPTDSGYGIVSRRFTTDSRGFIVKNAGLDLAGRPVCEAETICETRAQYDVKGNIIESSVHGKRGQLVEDSQGIARKTFSYDNRGNRTETRHFGKDGVLTECRSKRDGMAHCAPIGRDKFDELGNVIESSFWGKTSRLLANPEGVAKTERSFDTRGNELETRFYGADEKLRTCQSKAAKTDDKKRCVAIIRRSYDSRGLLERRYYDAQGNLQEQNGGCAIEQFNYDKQTYLAEARCLGSDGQPSQWADGISVQKTRYDRVGRLVSLFTTDITGKVLADKDYTYQSAPNKPPEEPANIFVP